MMKFAKITIALAAVGLLAAGCTASNESAINNSNSAMDMNQNTDSSNTNTAPVAANSVEISDFKFSPATLTVKKGTTVTWTNKDDAHHNVVAQGANAATGPKSELLAKGETYSYTFNTVGEYNYLCEPHPYMTAKVIVTE